MKSDLTWLEWRNLWKPEHHHTVSIRSIKCPTCNKRVDVNIEKDVVKYSQVYCWDMHQNGPAGKLVPEKVHHCEKDNKSYEYIFICGKWGTWWTLSPRFTESGFDHAKHAYEIDFEEFTERVDTAEHFALYIETAARKGRGVAERLLSQSPTASEDAWVTKVRKYLRKKHGKKYQEPGRPA